MSFSIQLCTPDAGNVYLKTAGYLPQPDATFANAGGQLDVPLNWGRELAYLINDVATKNLFGTPADSVLVGLSSSTAGNQPNPLTSGQTLQVEFFEGAVTGTPFFTATFTSADRYSRTLTPPVGMQYNGFITGQSPGTSWSDNTGSIRISLSGGGTFNLTSLYAYRIDNSLANEPILGLPQSQILGMQAGALGILPANLTLAVGQTAILTATAPGSPASTYQWRKNGSEIAGATNASLTIANAAVSDTGSYDVVATNSLGSVTSNVAMLTVELNTRITASGSISGGVNVFGDSAQITITNTFPNHAIYYSTDGSAPFIGGPLTYTAPFLLTSTATIRALGVNLDDFSPAVSDPLTVTILPTYALTVAAAGGGTVAKSPPAASYLSNSVVTLTATPDSGWTFLNWTGDATGINATTTVTMDRARNVQAVFGTTLTTSVAGSGSVLLSPANGPYPYGSVVRLTPKPGVGSYFSLWGGAASGTSIPLDFTVAQPARNIAAAFTALGVGQVNVYVDVVGNGSVSVSPSRNVYSANETVTLSAVPGVQQVFTGWSGDLSGAQNPVALALTASKSVTANFQAGTIIAVSAPRQVVNLGQSLTLSVTATSSPTPTYQWRRNGLPIPGATAANYTIAAAIPARDRGWYQAVVTAGGGSATSDVVFVNVAINAANSVSVVGLGANDGRMAAIPSGLSGVAAMAAGDSHALVLKQDGTMVGWGSNSLGQTTIPVGLNEVVAMAAGNAHSLALRSDGTVVGWGYNQDGVATPPPGLSGVVAVAGGSNHSLALKSDGTVVAWGSNGSLQTTIPSGLSGVIAIAAGASHSLALKSDGTVVGWGLDSTGQTTIPPGLSGVVAVAAGYDHSLALKSDGTVIAWGNNAFGATTVPSGLSGVIAVAAGPNFSLALQSGGTVVGWGDNAAGQVSFPPSTDHITSIGAGHGYSLLLRDSTGDIAPAIITQPLGQTVALGQSVTFSVAASAGGAPLSYQWRKNGASIAGATAATLTLASAGPADAGSYDVVVSSTEGTALSNAAALVVLYAPAVTVPPANRTVIQGQSASFSVTAAGFPTPTYQWRKDGVNIAENASAAAATLTLANVQASDAGSYDVVITNSEGRVTSTGAVLAVNIPPAFTVHPISAIVTVGNGITFSAAAAGTPAPTYQWRKNGTSLSGATADSYTIAQVAAVHGGSYDLVATNAAGSATSNAAILTVNVPPAITAQPQNLSVTAAQSASFTVVATGAPAPTYQWRKDGIPMSGATSAAFTITGTQPGDAGSYDVIVTNLLGSVTSNAATLTVNIPPTIFQVPASVSVTQGQAASLSVNASGSPPPAYQWRKAGINIPGATNATLEFVSVQVGDAGTYDVVVSNTAGAFVSPAAILTINVPPAITTQPANCTVLPGQAVTLAVAATGSPAPSYQWRKNGTPIPGATTDSFSRSAAVADDSGDYDVVVTNVAGSVTSNKVTLTVSVPPTITTPPATIAVGIGTNTAFSVSASGTPPLSYQWSKDDTVLPGATTASLPLANVSFSSAGAYRVTVSNLVGSVTSDPAGLAIVDAVPTHAVMSPGYVPGKIVTISNTLIFSSATTGVGWSVLLPAGWSYLSGGTGEGEVKPVVGTTGLLEWAWTDLPASPIAFTYTLSVPAGASGDVPLAALAVVRQAGVVAQITARPDPLVVSQVPTHSADTDRDFRISLLELTRVIELYNTRDGSTRTGCYVVQPGTEDGYAPDPTRPGSTVVSFAAYYAGDSDRDGKISLLELTRVIELYNTRSGTTRTGQYHVQAGTEDGFAPGPAP